MGSIQQTTPSNFSAGHSPFANTPLPRRIDEIAASSPSREWMITPRSSDIHADWRTITFGEFAKAINGACKWIERTVGPVPDQRETVAYMGLNDVRYAVIIVALMKTNRRAMLLSLRNSDEAQLHLLQRTDSTHYIFSEGIENHLHVFEQHSEDLHGHQVPTFDQMVALGEQHGHYESQGREDTLEQVLIIHTSGSTGLPKPIYLTNAWVAQIDHQKYIKAPAGRKNRSEGWMGPTADGKPMFVPAPFYHAMGTIALTRSIYTGPLVLPPLNVPLNENMLSEILLLRKATTALFPPALLEQLSETEKGLKALSTLDDIFFGGAPLSREAGDRVRKVTRINSIIGSTEASLIMALEPEDPADWEYFEWHPYSGVVMEDAGDGLYEQVLKPIVDPRYLSVFSNFPEITEWRTKDLWEEHPTKKGLWRYKGRRDDVIVFSNGEKFNPVSFEKAVEAHALVRGAVVVGQNRFQPAILIEPDWSRVPEGQSLDDLLTELWPAVEEANKEAPAHAQVWKNKVAFTKKDKPFVRAPKGSIIRRATVNLYAQEFDALYSSESFDEQLGNLPKDADLPTIRAFVRNAISLTVPLFKDEHTDDQDILDLGVDSLQVMALASSISHAIKDDAADRGAKVLPRDIYASPSVNKLAATIQSKLSANDADAQPAKPREQIMAEMVEKYTSDLPQTAAPLPSSLPEQQTVILTGSTGSLGNYILETLIAMPSVAHIYCLNRSDSAAARQAQSFAERDVAPDFSKVTFLRTDFSQDLFGLPQATYDELAASATLFIHNAWAVDFNHALQSYEPTHIAGTRRVVDFSLHSRHRAHVAFISSIASVANWPRVGDSGAAAAVPETFIDNDSAPLPQGYGESKHVASRILAVAAQRAGVPASIFRCGQLAGPRQEKGCWNRHEWLPSIVHTSKNMGVVPANLGNQDAVDWVPMDAAARTVVEASFDRLLRTQGSVPLDVFHVVNPRVVSWRELVPVVQAFYREQQGVELEAVPFSEWMRALKATPLTKEEIEKKPGVKLVEFYEGLQAEGGSLPPMETGHTQECSECLRELGEVDGGLFENWLRQWGF
ncbi:Non-canonical non-ribosomal peptide synthetase FUB8 [Lasiodiplodia theobromae]|uniref:Non-canonical non-ribosomal peptide synthetase FUB8 n=1 Tax=Lasiodiplodia theobromae TaxID=45133 RepID=A0A5N5CWC4_9PEZI|nr:Non-canonical non-ribosomal peptide synthetase FUB8 [Lasiodiplodia theobromae]